MWNRISAEEMQNFWDLRSEIPGHDESTLRNTNQCQKDFGVHVIWNACGWSGESTRFGEQGTGFLLSTKKSSVTGS